MLGCCGALVFSCSGSVAGVMCDELEEDDPRLDQVEWHSWYGDTGLPAPDERNADTGTPCRCGD